MSGSIIVKSRVKETIALKDQLIQTALEVCGIKAEAYAVKELDTPKPHGAPNKYGQMTYPNVDTGLLHNSINHEVVRPNPGVDQMHVGTNVDYAIHVEKGTHKSRAYPYLTPAIRDHVNIYSEIIKKILRQG